MLPETARADDGEILLMPPELWEAIDEATTEAARAGGDARQAVADFAAALVRGLHQRNCALLPYARTRSSHSIDADIYALMLTGKHAAERSLQRLRAIVRGDGKAVAATMTAELGRGLAALTGQAPPADRTGVACFVARWHQLQAELGLVAGPADADPLEPFAPANSDDAGGGAGALLDGRESREFPR